MSRHRAKRLRLMAEDTQPICPRCQLPLPANRTLYHLECSTSEILYRTPTGEEKYLQRDGDGMIPCPYCDFKGAKSSHIKVRLTLHFSFFNSGTHRLTGAYLGQTFPRGHEQQRPQSGTPTFVVPSKDSFAGGSHRTHGNG